MATLDPGTNMPKDPRGQNQLVRDQYGSQTAQNLRQKAPGGRKERRRCGQVENVIKSPSEDMYLIPFYWVGSRFGSNIWWSFF